MNRVALRNKITLSPEDQYRLSPDVVEFLRSIISYDLDELGKEWVDGDVVSVDYTVVLESLCQLRQIENNFRMLLKLRSQGVSTKTSAGDDLGEGKMLMAKILAHMEKLL